MTDPQLDRDVVYFGRTDFRNAGRLFGIKRSDRRQHMYVIGKTGTGKTTLLKNMVVQDIANGEGLCVIDPHGEFVEELLESIPEERKNDIIYFNPADPDFHIGFNVLELPDPQYKNLVASGLMAIFTKIWAGVWSSRMEYILNNAVLALLDTPGSTLLGITRILVDKEFRQQIINNIKDPVVKAFWVNEYESWQDKFRNEAIAPLQNKVGQFLSTTMVRNIVGQSKSTIDTFDIMNTGKIFLVNVSKGRIGEDNSSLLGAMLITKIQLSAMERVRIPEDERVDFYLYVDEFQNFATDSFAGILSEARKYRLNLTLAHQYIGQLVTDVSTKVRDGIFGNVGTMVVFRVGAADAEFLENEFEPEFVIQDIVNLPNRCIYLKLMCDGITTRPFSAATLKPFKLRNPVTPEIIIENCRKRYAKPRTVVEEEVRRWSGMSSGPEGGSESTESPKPSGEGLRPRLPRSIERPVVRRENIQELAKMGIEFDMSSESRPEPTRTTERRPAHARPFERRPAQPNRQPFPPKQKFFAAQEEKRESAQPVKSMSLSDLKTNDGGAKPKHHTKQDVDISSLRDAIRGALSKNEKHETPEQDPANQV